MTGRLEDLRAVNNGGGDFIGRLLWFSVSDMKVDRDTLEDLFSQAGIDHKYLPKGISPRDALRRATKEIEVKREPNGQKGVYTNLLVREVTCDKERLVRQVVRETVDSDNTRLGYDVIASVVLEGQDYPALNVQGMGISLHPKEQRLIDSVYDRFSDAIDYYNGKNVRDIVKKVLFDCNPVSVRPSGGVYFVPEDYSNVVEGLKEFTNALGPYSTTGENTKMYSVPVIDTAEQREMVVDSLEAQVTTMAEGILKEMAEAESGVLTKRRATQFVDRIKAMKTSVEEYKEWLESEKLKAESNLDVARKKAVKLLGKVQDEGGDGQ